MCAISALIRPDRYPLSSRYDPRWVSGLLEGIESAWLPDGRENWIRWVEAVQSVSGEGEAAVLDLLEGETGT